jgi:hypothetical protein
MNSSEGPETILTADATFRYTYFDVEKLFWFNFRVIIIHYGGFYDCVRWTIRNVA